MDHRKKTFSLRQLQYFVAVSDAGSYRRAAAELGVSQPALTTQILALEELIGLKLFERSRGGTLLSAEGRELLPQARQVLVNAREFSEQAAMISRGHEVTYKLGVPPTLGPYLLPNVLPDLQERYPHLKLYVREAPPRTLQRKLMEGEYDLAIVPLPLEIDKLAMEPLFTEPLQLVIPTDHPLAGRSSISASQLRGEKVLTLDEQHHFHHEVQEICQRLGAHIQRDYEGTSLDTLRQMVVMGMGVAFLPGLYLHSKMHQPEAIRITEIRGQHIRRHHALVWRGSSPGRTFYRELAYFLRARINHRLGEVVSALQ
jgi:LysR family transcriptional regulator, hydrogen peroxide-inducible genes activator